MKAADWFTVGVRLVGVWFVAQSVLYAVSFLDVTYGFSTLRDGTLTPNAFLLYAAANLFLGLLLMLGAGLFTGLCYVDSQTENSPARFMEDEDFAAPGHRIQRDGAPADDEPRSREIQP